MKYATIDGISRKLKGRLKIPNDDTILYPTDNPGQIVDEDLISLLIEETEEFVDYRLNAIYELPLLNEHPIVRNIVESLVISDLITIHFTGVGGGISGDNSRQGDALKERAMGYLAELQNSAIELRGERAVSSPNLTRISNTEIYMGKLPADKDHFITTSGYDNPFSEEYTNYVS